MAAFVEAVPESFRAASRGYQSSYALLHEAFCLGSTFSANDSVEAGIHGHASPEKGAKVILIEKNSFLLESQTKPIAVCQVEPWPLLRAASDLTDDEPMQKFPKC